MPGVITDASAASVPAEKERPSPAAASVIPVADSPAPQPASAEGRGDSPSEGDETAIRGLLHAFESAFANQSTPELRRLQPSLDTRQLALYESRFLDVKAFVVELRNARLRQVAPGRVAVTCTIQRDITLADDSHRVHSGPALVTVERDGNRWRVAALQAPSWW